MGKKHPTKKKYKSFKKKEVMLVVTPEWNATRLDSFLGITLVHRLAPLV